VVYRSLYPEFLSFDEPRSLQWTVRIPTHVLSAGSYSVMINMQTLQGNTVYAMKAQDAVTLTVRRGGTVEQQGAVSPVLTIDFAWEIEAVGAA
jgi:hypothetical protein